MIEQPLLYTGYFAMLKQYTQRGYYPISIARYTPKWYKGDSLSQYAPSPELLSGYKNGEIDMMRYRQMYMEHINTFNPYEVREYVQSLNRPVVIFLCYEKSRSFCHRHFFAEWLRANNIHIYEAAITK